ncbi:SRPBCC family protein [Streptomyces sp. NPDC019990]|uniref:SRPBCC family protein n=1 Tax=Streptomyces sp. NPDC019990 TaxID=3154693 RepID=UPI0033C0E379
MASIMMETVIEADAAEVWSVIGDFEQGPPRIAPGFVIGTELVADDVRTVTFANGDVVDELLVSLDHEAQRIVWAVTGGTVRPRHDNASFQVVPKGERRSRLVWIRDVLPDELAPAMAANMADGLAVIREALSARPDPGDTP